MDQQEVLARKKVNLEKLIQNMDEAIRNEMLKYDEAEFCIRLQSECFGLYPIVVKALSLLIADDKRREIFCSFLKGHKLERLAAFHNLTPEEAVQMFRSTVRELRQKIDNGAFTAKESINMRLMMERNELRYQLRNYSNLYKELQLRHQIVNNELQILQADLDKKTENEQSIIHQKEETRREEIKEQSDIRKSLQAEIKQPKEVQPAEKTARTSRHIFDIIQWIKWLRIVYARL